jgi:glutamyl/glutaminyl-tRNA synthetase
MPADPTIRVRIAPSPTGPLHIGTARTALFNYLYARHVGGTFVFRLEDTDVARSTTEFERDILEGLDWLGIAWDEGPDPSGGGDLGPYAPYRQMERAASHTAAAARLLAADLAYPCFCSPEELEADRKAQEAAKLPPRYVGRCANLTAEERAARLAEGRKPATRFRVRPGVVGWNEPDPRPNRDRHHEPRRRLRDRPRRRDAALQLRRGRGRRRDGDQPCDPRRGPRQQHAEADPDVRGARPSGSGVRPPSAHPEPGRDEDEQAEEPDRGRRLSRPGLPPRRARQLPRLPRLEPGHRGGRPVAPEVVERFDIGAVQKGGARFDRDRLEWLNGQWIRRLEPDDLVDRLRPFLEAAVADGRMDRLPADEEIRSLLPIVQERLPTLAAIVDLVGFLWTDDLRVDPAILVPKRWDAATTRDGLAAARDTLAGHDGVTWEADELEPPLRALVEARGWKAGDLFMAIRVATTGRTATPPLFDTLVALGRERHAGPPRRGDRRARSVAPGMKPAVNTAR